MNAAPLTAPAPDATGDAPERRRLHEAAEAFESLFVQTLIRRMREAQLEDGFFGTGPGASLYEGLFEQHLSRELGASSMLGLARLLEEQWSRRIEEGRPPRGVLDRLEALHAERGYRAALDEAAPARDAPAVDPPGLTRGARGTQVLDVDADLVNEGMPRIPGASRRR